MKPTATKAEATSPPRAIRCDGRNPRPRFAFHGVGAAAAWVALASASAKLSTSGSVEGIRALLLAA